MNDKNLEINGLFIAGIIIIVSFVFAINLQPVVFGTDTTFFLKNDNCSYDLMSFRSYKEFSCFNYNYSTSPGLLLKSNIEIMEDSDFTFQSVYIYKLSIENNFGYQGRVMQR